MMRPRIRKEERKRARGLGVCSSRVMARQSGQWGCESLVEVTDRLTALRWVRQRRGEQHDGQIVVEEKAVRPQSLFSLPSFLSLSRGYNDAWDEVQQVSC
jgi:hypothetical protein